MGRKTQFCLQNGGALVASYGAWWLSTHLPKKFAECWVMFMGCMLFYRVWDGVARIFSDRKEEEEQAERAADALRGTCKVDGYELPAPDRPEWTVHHHQSVTVKSTGVEYTTTLYRFPGEVVSVSAEEEVYIDRISLRRTPRTKTYAHAVIAACVRRSLDKVL